MAVCGNPAGPPVSPQPAALSSSCWITALPLLAWSVIAARPVPDTGVEISVELVAFVLAEKQADVVAPHRGAPPVGLDHPLVGNSHDRSPAIPHPQGTEGAGALVEAKLSSAAEQLGHRWLRSLIAAAPASRAASRHGGGSWWPPDQCGRTVLCGLAVSTDCNALIVPTGRLVPHGCLPHPSRGGGRGRGREGSPSARPSESVAREDLRGRRPARLA